MFHIKNVHHVGVTVRDMKRSFEWYRRIFGLEPGAVNHGSGADLERGLQVDDAEISYAMITVGTTMIEFLEYHHPEGKDFDRTNGDVGSSHICFEVDDMDAAYAEMTDRGAVFNAPPVTLADGAFAGSRWVYLRDPDGIQLELWQYAR